MKKEILELTGLTEDQFYKKYPTETAFKKAYPGYKKKLGGSLPEAFNMSMPADKFFSYGVPVPPMYYKMGGSLTNVPVYPQAQTEAQFFVPTYSNSNNAYKQGGNIVGGSYLEVHPEARNLGWSPTNNFMLQQGGVFSPDMQVPGTLPMLQQGSLQMGGNTQDQQNMRDVPTERLQSFLDTVRGKANDSLMREQENQMAGMRNGGALKTYQGSTGPSQTGTTTTNANATTSTEPQYRIIKTQYGDAIVDNATGQAYFSGFPQQQQQQSYYPNYGYGARDYGYYPRQPVFQDSSGVFNIASGLGPLFGGPQENPRWRDVKFSGIDKWTPEQLEAFKKGTANLGDFYYETKRRGLAQKLGFGNPDVSKVKFTFNAPGTTANQTVATTPSTTAKGTTQQSTNAAPAVSQQMDRQQAPTGMMPNIPTGLEDGESIDPIGYVDPGMSDANMRKATGVNEAPIEFRRGGPYALPMFQMAGSFTGENPFYIPTSEDGQENSVMAPVDLMTNEDGSLAGTGVLQPGYALTKDGETVSVNDPFTLEADISKKKGVKKATEAMINIGTPLNNMIETAATDKFNKGMTRADQVFQPIVYSNEGDHDINSGLFRSNNQTYAVGSVAQYGGAPITSGDGYFLSREMLDKLRAFIYNNRRNG